MEPAASRCDMDKRSAAAGRERGRSSQSTALGRLAGLEILDLQSRSVSGWSPRRPGNWDERRCVEEGGNRSAGKGNDYVPLSSK